jgi:hypothetical protein
MPDSNHNKDQHCNTGLSDYAHFPSSALFEAKKDEISTIPSKDRSQGIVPFHL